MAYLEAYHRTRMMHDIDIAIQEARFQAMLQDAKVTVSPIERHWSKGFSLSLSTGETWLHPFPKNRLTIDYYGFPNNCIQLKADGSMIGNGHFVVNTPHLPEKRWVLNQHGAFYPIS